jgi:flavin-dependent dehydrogenase
MSPGSDVVIAGGGVAGAAAAIRLRSLGASVRLLVRDGPPMPGIEAVPLAGLELLAVLGEPDLRTELAAAEIDLPTPAGSRMAGAVPHRVVHVDRTRLADVFLRRAQGRGATVERVTRLPAAAALAPGVDALVDATGRAAAWSRPVHHQSRQVAWQFEAPPTPTDDHAGRVVRSDGWWAYRLGHPAATWAAVVTPSPELPDDVRRTALHQLGLDPGTVVARGRRPAGVQWSRSPVGGRRLAVGDAALAHDPIAGQGIRFALASAIAAGTTIATWAGPDDGAHEVASAYYRGLVLAERDRHLATLAAVTRRGGEADDPREPPAVQELPGFVRFVAPVVEIPLVIDDRVALGPAIRLADGGTTRWAGSFDLLELARMAAEPTSRLLLATLLQEAGLTAAGARSLLRWALVNGVLEAAPGPGSLLHDLPQRRHRRTRLE